MAKKPYYLTTAIAYASGKPHIGNTYEIVLADAIARYRRFQGYDVRFQTGTDEHGQKIEQKTENTGETPKQYVDNVSGEIKRIFDLMNTSYDKFIRTTDADHEKRVQKIFRKLYDKGDIYKGFYEGMYCTPCESFFTPSQLLDGKCPECRSQSILRRTRNLSGRNREKMRWSITLSSRACRTCVCPARVSNGGFRWILTRGTLSMCG